MMNVRNVAVRESEHGPYGQTITTGAHAMTADEPIALGACTAMTIRMYANRKGMALRHVEVRLSHPQRATQAKGLPDRFERVIVIDGDLTPEERQRLLEIADRCPVSQTLKRGAEIASALAPA